MEENNWKDAILICIDDDSQDEDLGMSGIVLRGNHALRLGKEYEVENVSYRHVPKNSRRSIMSGEPDEKIWTDEEYEGVK